MKLTQKLTGHRCLLIAFILSVHACKGADPVAPVIDEDLFEQGIVEYEFDEEMGKSLSLTSATSSELEKGFLGEIREDLPLNIVDKCKKIKSILDKKITIYDKRNMTIARLSQDPKYYPKKYKKIIRNKVTIDRIHRKARVLQRLGCMKNMNSNYLLSQNHIVNGDFELRQVPENKSWDLYSQQRTPGWRVEYASNNSDTCDSGALLEFQTKETGVLKEISGKQFAELDSHCYSDRTVDTRVRIYQVINTIPGKTYKVSFLAAARASQGELQLNIYDFKGKNSLTEISNGIKLKFGNTGNDLKNQVLSEYVHYFTATGDRTKISFQDTDEDKKTYGVLLDDIKVVALTLSSSIDYIPGDNIKEERRTNPQSIHTYENENFSSLDETFLSLGLGGKAIVSFSEPIVKPTNGPIPKIYVSEITYGDNEKNTMSCGSYLETAKISLILQSGEQVPVVKKVDGQDSEHICGDHTIDLSSLSISSAVTGLIFEDTTPPSNKDGYDIDYIGFPVHNGLFNR
jgi:hypothetical protein